MFSEDVVLPGTVFGCCFSMFAYFCHMVRGHRTYVSRRKTERRLLALIQRGRWWPLHVCGFCQIRGFRWNQPPVCWIEAAFLQACRPVWAKFYVRFAQLMKEKGLSLWGFSVQWPGRKAIDAESEGFLEDDGGKASSLGYSSCSQQIITRTLPYFFG